ncbi:MAG: pH regulation protein F [Acidobacteria bacterium]|nr:MAG: pH regulation protein F [Acidobacteriota bacterium]REK10556.1 MAG: pH regulation protein F [Acidobacteriota bacterium]
MFAVAMAAVVITLLLALIRVWRGPTAFDRLLAANMVGTKTVLLIAVSGFLLGRPDFLDLALLYTLVNFIGVIAVCRFARFGSLADDSRRLPLRDPDRS